MSWEARRACDPRAAQAGDVWKWFLEGNDVAKRQFLKELAKEIDPAKTIERLFVKVARAELSYGNLSLSRKRLSAYYPGPAPEIDACFDWMYLQGGEVSKRDLLKALGKEIDPTKAIERQFLKVFKALINCNNNSATEKRGSAY